MDKAIIILSIICVLAMLTSCICAVFSGLHCDKYDARFPRSYFGPKCFDVGMVFYLCFFGKQAAKVKKRTIDYIGFGFYSIFVSTMAILLSIGACIQLFHLN